MRASSVVLLVSLKSLPSGEKTRAPRTQRRLMHVFEVRGELVANAEPLSTALRWTHALLGHTRQGCDWVPAMKDISRETNTFQIQCTVHVRTTVEPIIHK